MAMSWPISHSGSFLRHKEQLIDSFDLTCLAIDAMARQ